MSGVFWMSEEDWGARGIGGETEARERVVRVYKARCTNYSLFPRTALFFCVAALELVPLLG